MTHGLQWCRIFLFVAENGADSARYGHVPKIFGRGGYALLRRPELLPSALMEVVRCLVAGSA